MPPYRQSQIEAREIHHGKGSDSVPVVCDNSLCHSIFHRNNNCNCTPVVIHKFKHHASNSTIWLGSIPILRENNLEEARSLPSIFPFHQPRESTCGYLEYPLTVKALYICKHPCLLQDLNPGPTAQKSASLATIPDGLRQRWLLLLQPRGLSII
ncbi:uncharacterized protein TNCV_1024041 [Trichonephila clavipes]|nr:uncharacterized protein TNCV_1024041 [Trichonephila clavipes]